MNELTAMPESEAAPGDQRAALYAWFATLYARELTAEQLQTWFDGGADPLFDGLAHAGFSAEVADMQGAIEALRSMPDAQLELAADYTTSFLLDLKSCALPYASCYLGESQTLFGPEEKAMRDKLERYGLGLDSNYPEAADHLAIQLELLSWLAMTGKTDDEQDMLVSLLRWVPAFSEKCQALNTHVKFYSALSRMLCRILQAESAVLAESGMQD
ncbi:molecular chaperone TorD [Iodobacter ciconiae]|uniref:Molecular chaperone TorD n=1 Tax=Iodobacter ciconiae TaxID=2496266 RepID=A0A3S8ZWF9_9NEIS|nr:molecular chaperone TorD [Iodobacter ciconiae]AZN37788.1 molecular chaperone TorD [Iodobacter ciconiae]